MGLHRMRRHLTLILLLFSCIVRAQFPTNESKWGVSLSPAIVPTPGFSFAIQPGAEYRISERFYVLSEIAFPISNLEKESMVNRKYLRLKAEARFLFSRAFKGITRGFIGRGAKFNKYLGLQVSYAFRSFRNVNGGTHFVKGLPDSIAVAFDNANIKSPIFTASLQYGTIYELSENFYIDAFVGIGSRTIRTHYTNVTNAHLVPYAHSRSPVGSEAYLYPGSVTRFHANCGIRFLYRF